MRALWASPSLQYRGRRCLTRLFARGTKRWRGSDQRGTHEAM